MRLQLTTTCSWLFRAQNARRNYYSHSACAALNPVELASLTASPTKEAHGSLVILHGLFGSKRNWTSLHKAFHRALPHHSVHTLDLRNHGASPRATPMTYLTMAVDVLNYIDTNNLTNVTLLGHSMGGKTAMTLALLLACQHREDLLSHLVISDIAPTQTALSEDFVKYIDAMQAINELPLGSIKSRGDVDHKLHKFEPDLAIRQFLMTNLVVPRPSQSHTEKLHFNLPLDILRNAIPDLGSFPYDLADPARPRWQGRTLVFRGMNSSYIDDENQYAFEIFFPRVVVEKMETGHWVHAEKPNEFKDLVVCFMAE